MGPVKIFADFNGLVFNPETRQPTGVVLDTFGSARDLANAGIILHEGLILICLDASDEVEDLEACGRAKYDWEHNWWMVEFDEYGITDVPAGDRAPIEQFLCVKCRTDLWPLIASHQLATAGTCPQCNMAVFAALAKPEKE